MVRMTHKPKKHLMLFSGRSHPALAEAVAAELDVKVRGVAVRASGEPQREGLPLADVVVSRAFAERRVAKHYTAIVGGLLVGAAGTIELPLAADWPNRPRQWVWDC